jgi:hypothetical protein
MSKIKKALKKLGLSGAGTKAKTMAAKSPSKPAAKKVVKAATVKGAPAKKAAPAKAQAKAATKPAPVKGKPAAKPAPVKATAKAAAPVKGKTAPVKPGAAVKAAKAAAPAGKAPKAEKVEAKKSQATAAPAPTDAPAPKAAKSKKSREEVPAEPEEEIILLDADGRRYCRVRECDQASAVDGYCRFHYLLYWKNIQVRKAILTEGKLERYIEDLTARYPDKYLEMLKKDLRTEKDFLAAIQELEIDESSVDNEYEAQNYLDEVRGMSSEAGASDRDEEF